MIKYITIILLVLTACNSNEEAYKYRLEGKKLYADGKYEKAIRSYEKALEINPDYDTVMLNIGMCYWRLNDCQKAQEYFRNTIEINAQYDKAYINLGRVLTSPESKLNNFNKGIKHARNDTIKGLGYKLIGDVYIKQKRYRLALENYNESLSLFPEKIDLLRMCGTLNSKLLEFSKANELHKKAINLAPNEPENHNDYGTSLQRQGKIEDAITMHKKALTLSPESFKYGYNLATAYFTNANYDMAFEEIEKCLKLKANNHRALLLKGKISMKNKDLEAACTVFNFLCSLASKEGVDLSKFNNVNSISLELDDLNKNMKSISEYVEAMRAGIHPTEMIFYEAFLLKKHLCND